MNPAGSVVAEARLAVLDGWRGISILLVLAAHMLPLGPKAWRLNDAAGPMGMALFFTLSGFLITRFLLHKPSITDFLIRRVFRIVPLAWLTMAILLLANLVPTGYAVPNLLFYANLPPQTLIPVAGHLWSLCIEMQFYVGIALLVAALGRPGLLLVPLLCLAVTGHRIATDAPFDDIVTWRRVDEILAGATLALCFEGRFGPMPARLWRLLSQHAMLLIAVLLLLLALGSHPSAGWFKFARPYVAAALVGVTLLVPSVPLGAVLRCRALAYVAATSYALYVVHQPLMFTWLGEGDKFTRYLKRPLLLATVFALAHLSTFQFERRCSAWGHRFSAHLARRNAARRTPVDT